MKVLIVAVMFMVFSGSAFAQVPPSPAPHPAAPGPPLHHAVPVKPMPHVIAVQQPSQPQGWGIGSWLAAPFVAVGNGIGYVAAGVGNVVETPFIAVGQAWSNNNCWRKLLDPHDGQQKLFWICKPAQ